ncbi:MAG: iron-containing alcohol dehydrogenase [Spirochaetia bacterium]|nr:iron-containing alcohol dehydrogenase [Spirochaetia bacterium]
MNDLEFYVPSRAFCYYGAISQLGRSCFKNSRRILLITNSHLPDTAGLKSVLSTAEANGLNIILVPDIYPYSSDSVVDEVMDIARISYIEGVIGYGDVDALSVARAVALLTPQKLELQQLYDGLPDHTESLPYVEIPATSRTPFLFNGGLVLGDRYDKSTRFLQVDAFRPCAVIQDPALLKDFSRKYRVAALLDTLLLAVESYFSRKATFLSETLSLRAIGVAINNMNPQQQTPDATETLFQAQQAGFFAGLGLSMSAPGWGTAAAYSLGRLVRVPQPIIATILLPYVLEYGIKVCPEKVARMGNILGENLKGLSVVAAADRVVESLRASLGVDQLPGRLSEVGVEEQHLSQTAAKLLEVPFLEALPEPVSSQELFTFLKDAL